VHRFIQHKPADIVGRRRVAVDAPETAPESAP